MSGFVAAFFQPLRLLRLGFQNVASSTTLVKPDVSMVTSIRTNVRCHFPRPNEVRRVRRHGWKARLQTPEGRRIIMRRLLKGRYVLSH